MHRRWIMVLVIVQLAVLGYMAGAREYVLAYGKQVWLRTAPIDPRDPFRGDFVRLQYAFNNLPADVLMDRDLPVTAKESKGRVVYVTLRPGGNSVYRFDHVATEEPTTGLFLKGRVSNETRWQGSTVSVKYGIEQLFVQQGRGKEIETKRGARDELQVPMEVLVAVGGDGTAVVKDYRWSDLGMQLAVTRFNRQDPNRAEEDADLPLSPKIRLTLRNVSAQPKRLFATPQQCQFVLVLAFDPNELPLSEPADCANRVGDEGNYLLLAPDEETSFDIDLADPRWFVERDNERVEIGAVVDPNEMFRIVYRSSLHDQRADGSTDTSSQIWQGRLPSRAFNVIGRVD